MTEMTKSETHKIPNFVALFDDPRFQAVLAHLRSQIPRHASTPGHWFNGWHDAIDAIVELGEPIPAEAPTITSPRPQYQQPPTDLPRIP